MKGSMLYLMLLCLCLTNLISAREPLTNHPLVAPYEGSTIKRKKVIEFDEYNAFMGMDESGKQATGPTLEGKITKILYNKPKQRSILEVYRNYETAVQNAGADILYSCNQDKKECVKRYAGPTFQKFSDIHSISNLKGRYLLSRFTKEDHVAYVAIAVGQNFTDIHIIEVKAMDTEMVTLNADALGQGIDAKGFVIVEGIYFDTDKATIKPDSASALEQVSILLKARPKLLVYVVGHTDSQGSFEHNLDLSKKRAKAVVTVLNSDYLVPVSQMKPHGIGPLAPQATNKTDSGRAQNRRVVLVAQ